MIFALLFAEALTNWRIKLWVRQTRTKLEIISTWLRYRHSFEHPTPVFTRNLTISSQLLLL